MALPLLMMAGAGILGGTQYLMKKQDDEKVQSLLPDFNSAMASSPFAGTPGAMMMEQKAQRIAQDDSFFASNKSGEIESMLDNLQGATFQQQQMAANQYAQSRQATAARAFGLSDQLDTDYRRDLGDLSTFQDTYRKGMQALQSNSKADILASAFNFYNLIEPGGIVRDDERDAYQATSSAATNFVNLLNDIQGKGLTESTAKQLANAMTTQYKPRYDRGQRQLGFYQERIGQYRKAGYDVASPVGSQGIDFQYGAQEYNPIPTPQALAQDAVQMQQSQAERLEQAAQARGRTTIDPNAGGRTSVRQQRRR